MENTYFVNNQSLDDARRFLNVLSRGNLSSEQFCFQWILDSEPRSAGHITGCFDEVAEQLVKQNNRGHGIFVTVNATDGDGRKSKNITKVRSVFIDADDWTVETEALLKKFIPSSIAVKSSLSTKKHFYWLVDECPISEFRRLQKSLVKLFNTDSKVVDLPRVMRLPGFYHLKDTPVRTELLSVEASNIYKMEEVVKAVEDLSAELGIEISKEQTSSYDKKILTEEFKGYGEGGRNSAIFTLAYQKYFIGRRLSLEECLVLCLLHNQKNKPPLSREEVEKTVRSAHKRFLEHQVSPGSIVEEDVDSSSPPNADSKKRVSIDLLSHQRFAREFCRLYADSMCFLPERGWFAYSEDTGCWKKDECRFNEAVLKCIDIVGQNPQFRLWYEKESAYQSFLSRIYSQTFIEHVKKALVNNESLRRGSDTFDVHHNFLQLRNGVYDLDRGLLLPSNCSYASSKLAGCQYDAEAECPTWLNFLDVVMGGDDELVSYLQRVVGYIVSGYTSEQCLFFCYGTGANGKSVFIETIRKLLGEYVGSIPSKSLMLRANDAGANNAIASTVGKRLITVSEVNKSQKWDESLIKDLTGEDEISARFLYREYFEFIPRFKIMIRGNHKPRVEGSDDGIWRRLHLIPFEVKIPEAQRDKELQKKLSFELSGILNWALEGYRLWREEGLGKPEKAEAALSEYKTEVNSIRGFIDEQVCITRNLSDEMLAQDVYSEYRSWCLGMGVREENLMTFGLVITELGIKKRKTGGKIVYCGIKLEG